jgi:hypothetical protein
MLSRRFWVTLALASAALIIPSSATAKVPPGLESTTTDESGCVEIGVLRAGSLTALRTVVPTRYTLLVPNPNAPNAGRVIVTTYTCDQVLVDDHSTADAAQPTTVVIGSASITHRGGDPISGQYILWYATDNPVLFAKYQRLGLPVSLLRHQDAQISLGDVTSNLHWTIAGDGLDYDLSAIGTETATTTRSTSRWFYDGPRGDLELTFTNTFGVSSAQIIADFSQLQPLVPLLPNETLSCIPAARPSPTCPPAASGVTFPGSYARGSWTSDMTLN